MKKNLAFYVLPQKGKCQQKKSDLANNLNHQERILANKTFG
jgi:hypothetical protein